MPILGSPFGEQTFVGSALAEQNESSEKEKMKIENLPSIPPFPIQEAAEENLKIKEIDDALDTIRRLLRG